VHSFMISITAVTFLEKKLKHTFQYYRLFFNLFSTVSFFWILWYSSGNKGQLIFQWEGWLQIIQILLLFSSAVLFLAGGRNYDFLQFIGLRQVLGGTSHTSISETDKINTSGILGITRHPWYLGAILFIWSVSKDIYTAPLIVKIIWTAYLIIGTFLEERKLVIEYGDEYFRYKQKVSMLFPFKAIFGQRK
jgi:protein-S-isoprenylcysteine O-methyltransferase Ste14